MATPTANSVPLTAHAPIDGLVQGGSWVFAGVDRVLTYSFNINDSELSPGNPIGGTWEASPWIEAAVHEAFAEWAKVANLTFLPTGIGGIYFDSTADIAITLTGDDLQTNFEAASLGIFPDSAFGDLFRDTAQELGFSYARPEGDLFFDNYLSAFLAANVNPGGLGFTYILHEIGHALGLKHPFDNGAATSPRPSFTELGIAHLDTAQNTLMGQAALANSNLSSGNVASPMLLDIQAIQRIYGANTTYNAGNDVYALQDDGILRTIWDAGGSDTFDASGVDLVSTLVIDLRPGGSSSHGLTGGTVIAYGVGIENAIGSAGADTIHGNELDNRLDGGTGEGATESSDHMIGYGGNDTYVVDSVNDVVTDAGLDTVLSSVSYTLPANVENLSLTGTGDISASGSSLANILTGNSGHNVLIGAGGNDTLVGGEGYDTAQFSGASSEYAFVDYLGSIRVADRVAARDGVDITQNVEQARFIGDNVTSVFTASDVFTPLEYIASYSDLMTGFGANAALGYEHFVDSGRFALRSASFDGLAYLASHPDLAAGLGLSSDSAATHYIQSGRFEGRSVGFNGLEYIASYTDLINSFGVNEDLGTHHYLSAGRLEGRTVSFRGLEYLASNLDLMNGFGANFELATIHYISAGRFEGRTSNFHALEYIASYTDLMDGLGANVNAGALHYISAGRFEGRAPSFKALEYIASYADLIQGIGANLDAGAIHYIQSGRSENRTESFDAAQYLANYADLQAGFGNNHALAATHFIQHGFHEGRTDQPLP
jgi:Ca2+-binding RTX toxin-like protein